MLQPYVPLLVLIAFVVANAIMILGLSHLLSSYRRTPVKAAPYESGMPVLGDARERFSVKFYLVAMLFIVFDIEDTFGIEIPYNANEEVEAFATVGSVVDRVKGIIAERKASGAAA